MKKLLSVSALALVLAACGGGASSQACTDLLKNYDDLAAKMPDNATKEQITSARGQLETALKSLSGSQAEDYCKQANAGFEQLKQAMDAMGGVSAPEAIEEVSATIIEEAPAVASEAAPAATSEEAPAASAE
ncbi:hypothetical protein [Neisseria sp. Ec49-e6-T10]|uniref:hypothetical protein n=1 Tax=Neisseria sp. Ec49-e6-T10 TaxID=3140744 RepID=UPI003EB77EA5